MPIRYSLLLRARLDVRCNIAVRDGLKEWNSPKEVIPYLLPMNPVRHLLFRFLRMCIWRLRMVTILPNHNRVRPCMWHWDFFIAGMKQCRELAAQWLSLMIRMLRWQITVSAGRVTLPRHYAMICLRIMTV